MAEHRRARRNWLLANLFCTGLGVGVSFANPPALAQADSLQGDGDVPTLEFAWSVPGAATVEETAIKDGVTTVVRYRLNVQPGESGHIIVTQSDMELLEFNGEDPEIALGVMHGPVLAMASSTPAMRIDPDGNFVDVVDLGATIDRMVELLVRDLTALDPETVRDMIVAARTPRVMKLTAEATGARWNNWVGHWVGLPFESHDWSYEEPGQEFEGMETLRSSALVERLPGGPDPDLAHMRMTMIWEGAPEVAAASETQTSAGGEIVRAADRDAASAPFSMEVSNTVEATLDLASLRPALVTTTTETVVHAGENSQTDSSRNEYRFNWHDLAEAQPTP